LWQDVDIEAGTVTIRRTWTRRRLGPTKTRQDRTLSILHPIADQTPEWRLRHTFASTMLSRNAPLLYVQQQGGRRSAAVLLRTYARWMPHRPQPRRNQRPQLAFRGGGQNRV
jgi:integrase